MTGCGIIRKNGQSDVLFMQASEYSVTNSEKLDERTLVNIIYHEGKYKLYKPTNKKEHPDNVIDNELWLITKFMPPKGCLVSLGDTIRFGRIPFKIVKLVLDVKQEIKRSKNKKESLRMEMMHSQSFQREETDSKNPLRPSEAFEGGTSSEQPSGSPQSEQESRPPSANREEPRFEDSAAEDAEDEQHDYGESQDLSEILEADDGWVDARLDEFVGVTMDQPEYGQQFNSVDLRSRNTNHAGTSFGFGGQSDTMLSMQDIAEQQDELPQIQLTKNLNLQPSVARGGLSAAVGKDAELCLESGKCCRICLEEEDDDVKNPFITPCKCQGSTKFIHVNCIRSWLDTKK
jgi:hypothetical protein